jgi:Protein of unknown function (DUF2795)
VKVAKVNPLQVQKFLGALDYPASKQDLIKRAEQEGVDENDRSIREQLPDGDYETPADVSKAIGKVK